MLSDPARSPWLKCLFYGAPGMGKTTLAGSAADVDSMADVLVLSAEGGSLAMLDNDRISRVDRIDEVPIHQLEQLTKAGEFIAHHCRARDTNNVQALKDMQALVFGIKPEQIGDHEGALMPLRKYRSVIIDSMTDIESQNLNRIMGIDAMTLDVSQMSNPDWSVYRLNNYNIMKILRSLRNQPIHIFVICAERYTQDEMKRYHYTPAVTGQLVGQIQGAVDIVGRLVISAAAAEAKGMNAADAQFRRLYVQSVAAGPRFDAKCRRASYKLPYFDDPTMTSMMEDLGLLKKSA